MMLPVKGRQIVVCFGLRLGFARISRSQSRSYAFVFVFIATDFCLKERLLAIYFEPRGPLQGVFSNYLASKGIVLYLTRKDGLGLKKPSYL